MRNMAGNCLLVISKNEGLNPISIAEQALESGVIDKVIISDGSNEETFNRLKKKETKKIEVISERKYVNTIQTGKGVGMINGGLAAIKQNFDRIGFIDGDIYNEEGLDIKDLTRWVKKNKTIKGYKKAKKLKKEEVLYLDVDILVPAAIENQIHDGNAKKIKANYILELANGPVTPKADDILNKKGVLIVPDVLANAGGVIVSYFEWRQNITKK